MPIEFSSKEDELGHLYPHKPIYLIMELIEKLLPVATLILGAFLKEIFDWVRNKREDKRKLKELLYRAFELWEISKANKDFYEVRQRKATDPNQPIDTNERIISAHVESGLRSLKRNPEEINREFNEILIQISKFDPLFANGLRNRVQRFLTIENIDSHVEEIQRRSEIVLEINDDVVINTRRHFFSLATDGYQSIVLNLSIKISTWTYLKTVRTILIRNKENKAIISNGLLK